MPLLSSGWTWVPSFPALSTPGNPTALVSRKEGIGPDNQGVNKTSQSGAEKPASGGSRPYSTPVPISWAVPALRILAAGNSSSSIEKHVNQVPTRALAMSGQQVAGSQIRQVRGDSSRLEGVEHHVARRGQPTRGIFHLNLHDFLGWQRPEAKAGSTHSFNTRPPPQRGFAWWLQAGPLAAA